jgi:hypothetical protein
MGTRNQHRNLRIDGVWLGLGLMVVSAVIVVAVGWFVLQAFLGMGTYIETVIP